ncbi:MAG: hypothetical protein NZT92_00050 [Abditibacteriales bacterium]|nr:hypothetical protein [Abditibacteriales bacterium]MDW8364901.1 hypothetical protein [Abditibacteriales bacterium]
MLDTRDATLPDLIIGENAERWGAVVVINATREPLNDLQMHAARKDVKPTVTPLPTVPPLTVRKVGFRLNGEPPPVGDTCEVTLKLERKRSRRAQTLDTTTVTLGVRRADQLHKRTFRSRIDGSVQYYAVNPAQPPPTLHSPPSTRALFLTLHGAGVEASGQAAADDNVPVAQARTMNQHLSGFHRDFVYHEQPGAGHWWDASDEPGTDCVDWQPMFDFFAHHAIPPEDSVRRVEFITASSGVAAKCYWFTISSTATLTPIARGTPCSLPAPCKCDAAACASASAKSRATTSLAFSFVRVRTATPLVWASCLARASSA